MGVAPIRRHLAGSEDGMSNEDLLREGECPHPSCIEPAGHDGPHTFPPDFIDGVRRGVAALNEGKITPWEEVERELARDKR